jgi:hypothetical protein
MRTDRSAQRQHDGGRIIGQVAGVRNRRRGRNAQRQHDGEIMDKPIAEVCNFMMTRSWLVRSQEYATGD